MRLTEKLSQDLYAIQTLTKQDTEQLHKLTIDFFAAAYAGFKQNKPFHQHVEKRIFEQGGAEESYVFLREKKMPAEKAAFLNAIYGHGAELDDGNKKAAGHAGVHLFPAVFALADKTGATCDDVLCALAVGYEAYIRISSAAQPGLVKRGFHSTGMAGTLACAAACAKLLHLDAQGIEDAIALATTMTGGLLSYGDSRPAIKPLNPGKAAENGVFAALLASAGVRGPEEALEGPNGWFHAVTDQYNATCLQGGDRLLLHDCYFKLYPSCRHTHCGIDAALALRKQAAGAPIKTVKVYIYPNAIKLAGQIKYPKNQDETKFSIHYTLACALVKGSYGIADMDPPDLSQPVCAVIDKIKLIPDESMENREKGIRGARVCLETEDGKTYSETVLVPRGDPENPLSDADILEKLRTCAKGQADDALLEKLVTQIRAVEGDRPFVNPMAVLL